MKIAEVLLRPAIGGAESLVENLRQHWLDEGHDVRILYVDEPGSAHGKVSRVRRLSSALRAFGPHVVHAHSALPNIYARLASRGRWPVVTVLHSAGRDFDTLALRVAERALGTWTAHVIAVSPGQVDEYRRHFGLRVPVSLVPNGVRADIVARSSASERVGQAVAIGRLDPQKRIDLLVEGWRRAQLPEAQLRIAGVASDESQQARVEAWAAGVPEITLVGPVTDVPSLLADSDLFVHAATEEAHPLAPIEAACAGLPIVVTDEVAATLPSGLPAVTFRGGDAEALRNALHTVAESYAVVAQNAIDRAPQISVEFSIAQCAARHLDVLGGCVAGTTLVAHEERN